MGEWREEKEIENWQLQIENCKLQIAN